MNPEFAVLLVLFFAESEGSAEDRPVVTFTPNWDKIFTGENVTMTCDVRPADMSYTWYKDNGRIHTGRSFVITTAESRLSGNYQCQGSYSNRSDLIRLEVSQDWVILQAPLYVHEGDDVTLRCHHYPGYTGRKTKFYKDNRVIRNWESDPEVHMENINMEGSGGYRCTKEVYHNLLYYKHSGEAAISVRELFTYPKIKATPSPAIENNSVTLTCDASPSPLRPGTELLFAFYKDGRNVQGFGSSDRYGVQSAQPEDSGMYCCEVQSESVLKRSKNTNLEVISQREEGRERNSHVTQNIIRLLLSGCILVTAFMFIYYHIKFIRSLETANERVTS